MLIFYTTKAGGVIYSHETKLSKDEWEALYNINDMMEKYSGDKNKARIESPELPGILIHSVFFPDGTILDSFYVMEFGDPWETPPRPECYESNLKKFNKERSDTVSDGIEKPMAEAVLDVPDELTEESHQAP